MANKKVFSYGNGGKRKIGHSKFDMGFEHIMSANFGALHPAAVYETLPDDYWDISDNTVTLLKPLTAPAMTRINQNFYAAYVRNQQIWRYWNDYISNGTAFGDVYGNNVTNQSLKNAWQVPSIPTPYLQTILKIGAGNASPVWHFSCSCSASSPYSGSMLAAFIYKNVQWHNISDTVVYRITDAVYAELQLSSSPTDSVMLDRLRQIGLSQYGFDVFMYRLSGKVYFLFELYCSMRQFLAFQSAVSTSFTPDNHNSPSTVGEFVSDLVSNSTPRNNHVAFRFFCDNISSEPNTSESAFLIEKCVYQDFNGNTCKSLDYYPRLKNTSVDIIHSVNSSSTSGYRVYQCLQTPYFGFRYGLRFTTSSSELGPETLGLVNFNPSSDFYWSIDTSNFGYPNTQDILSLMESWVQNVHYLGVSTDGYLKSLEHFKAGTPLLVSSSSSPSYVLIDNFGHQTTYSAGYPFTDWQVNSLCDLDIPFKAVNIANSLFDCPFTIYTRCSQSLGYDVTSLITYLCRNSLSLMDSFGIKVDPLSSRPFWHYRYETSNALPMFAYDKIWGDNFRNSVVSSPCIDWSCSNGEIFADNDFYTSFVFSSSFLQPAAFPSRYVGKHASDFTRNGWTLEITTLPRNSVSGAIHTHLPITSFADVFTFLTGFDFDGYFVSLSPTDLNVDDYYLPSYYNGLLHLKFQNFNKDYFTSALLDPMSGANQVSVGSTINELRENEAKQHWWERTAMYRSIKNFFQGTYGITPIELPEDSRITGTDHIDVNIGEVIQTSGSTPESPQGTRTGLGGCRGSGTLCHGHANEHGWIIVLLSHTIESQYLQVFDKMWDVKDSFMDYPVIDFAGIGNESISQKELNYTTVPTDFYDWTWYRSSGMVPISSYRYLPVASSASISYKGRTNPLRVGSTSRVNIANAAGTSLDNIFGFIPRYSSYKFKFDQVSGQFRHELNFWHTFKRYLTSPILCHEFVNWEMAADDDDINRIFAVSDDFLDDKFAIDCFINASVDRALPFVCVPMSK